MFTITSCWLECFLSLIAYLSCFPGDSDCRVCLQCGRLRFDPCVGKIPLRRKWQPIPVFLPGKSRVFRSLVGYSPWGIKEWGTTEWLTHTHTPAFFSTAKGWFIFAIVFCCCCVFIFDFAPLVNIHAFHIMHANSKAEWHTLDYEGHVSKNGTWERKKLLHIPPALNQQFHSLSSPLLMIWFFFHSNFRLLTSRTAQG